MANLSIHSLKQLEIKPITYSLSDNFDPDWEQLKIIQEQENASAIMMVHYFGQPQNINKYIEFSKKYNLKLIEDAAHGHSGTFNGKLLGTFGDIGFTSPRKFIESISGGILYVKKSENNLEDLIKNLPVYNLTKFNLFLKKSLLKFPKLKNKLNFIRANLRDWSDPYLFCENVQPDNLIYYYSKNLINSTNWLKLSIASK